MKQSRRPSPDPQVSLRLRTKHGRSPTPETEDSSSLSIGSALRVGEDSFGSSAQPPAPDERPQILVLEERHDQLHAAARLLKSSGYATNTIFEEGHGVASILAAEDTHFLLLTAHRSNRLLSIPRLIERLRQLRYHKTITCCVKGKVSRETQVAYEALTVNRVLALPAAAQRSASQALAWIAGQVELGESGLTILEV